jgi:AcrR family transcriptional regulator
MAQQATLGSAEHADGQPPVRRRLTAEARKASILEAARRAFIETGDANGTTVRVIAERAGISEGVIYRHFDSKDQLFIEAVVEPLSNAVDALVAATAVVDRDEPVTPERRVETMQAFYRRLTSALDDVLPLLVFVLFGTPEIARRFYRDSFAVAMDRLGVAWQEAGARYGRELESTDVSARAVMGMALIVALESHHDERVDRDRTIRRIAEGTLEGFFPPPDKRRQTNG